jgi:hypothetical protein
MWTQTAPDQTAGLGCGDECLYAFKNGEKLLVWRETHRSKCVQEGEPINPNNYVRSNT